MSDFDSRTYIWVEGVSPPIPPENATDEQIRSFMRGCVPAPDVIELLPNDDWEVAEIPRLDLHVVRIPYMAHTYAQPYLQRNVRSNQTRLLIAFPGYQVRDLRRVFFAVAQEKHGDLRSRAASLIQYSAEVLALQRRVEQATNELANTVQGLVLQPTIAGVDDFNNKTFEGVIAVSGTEVLVRLTGLDENKLVELAQLYIDDNHLGWRVVKPYAWSEHQIGPHVTLDSRFRGDAGHHIPVKLEKVYHFTTDTSRWVAIGVRLPAPYACKYGCHLSIGQERLKT